MLSIGYHRIIVIKVDNIYHSINMKRILTWYCSTYVKTIDHDLITNSLISLCMTVSEEQWFSNDNLLSVLSMLRTNNIYCLFENRGKLLNRYNWSQCDEGWYYNTGNWTMPRGMINLYPEYFSFIKNQNNFHTVPYVVLHQKAKQKHVHAYKIHKPLSLAYFLHTKIILLAWICIANQAQKYVNRLI